MPFDLTSVLGCAASDERLRDLLLYFEEQPRPSEREPEMDDCYYLSFPNSGFSLLLTGEDTVHTVHLYVLCDSDHRAFTDELPFALTGDTSQAQARNLFGPPSCCGGPVRPITASRPVTYWDRWDYERHSFHLQYPERRDSILLITLAVVELDVRA